MIGKGINRLFIRIITISVIISSATLLTSMLTAQWEIIDFIEHGTRRLVVIEDNRWFFYRSETEQELTLEIPSGKVMIKTAVRDDIDNLTYQLRIGNAFRNFNVSKVDNIDEFTIMEDVFINLGEGKHQVSISTPNRLAYFKVFLEEEVWSVPTMRTAFTPEKYEMQYTLKSQDTESSYFSASVNQPIEFTSYGPNVINGFARFFVNDDTMEGKFDVLVNNRLLETVTIPNRTTGSFFLEEKPDQNLSIGRRMDFDLPTGEHRVRILPRTEGTYIFRLIMDIPEELETKEETVYGLNAFREIPLMEKVLSGFQLSFGTTFRYADNIFSLSDHDMQRFDSGDERFNFIETRDDIITNPSLKARYPFTFSDFTIEPYINANYYYYLNNSSKSNYSLLSGLFTNYKKFNLNLYYGYYADLYVRDYFTETGNPLTDENFEYDRNLYRLYSFFNLTKDDTPLLYYQVEEYYHNEYFTGYDGTATTIGLGWRRSFPTFFLRAFYYYRVFEGENIAYNNDPSYESNIYDFQFRNKRVNLINQYDFRPYIGFRFENRFFTTDIPIELAPYQSTRNDRRYRFNLGFELYFIDNLDIIIDYAYFLRDSTSDNPNVARDKDYTQQSISVGFEYKINF